MQYDVTLRFYNEDAAKEFVADMLQHNAPLAMLSYQSKVINVQAVPVLWCRCAPHKGKAYRQGKTYGWWVCPQCNCVAKMVFDKWGHSGSGYNLLPNELREYKDTHHSPKEWRFLVNGSE